MDYRKEPSASPRTRWMQRIIPGTLSIQKWEFHQGRCLPAATYRCSSVCAYYTPFADRKNLVVLTGVLATRILWDNSSTSNSLHARGVEYRTSEGEVKTFSVRKEVILSAGTIGSPKVLELSGIGNTTYV